MSYSSMLASDRFLDLCYKQRQWDEMAVARARDPQRVPEAVVLYCRDAFNRAFAESGFCPWQFKDAYHANFAKKLVDWSDYAEIPAEYFQDEHLA